MLKPAYFKLIPPILFTTHVPPLNRVLSLRRESGNTLSAGFATLPAIVKLLLISGYEPAP